MLDQDVVATTPSSVYRILKNAGVLRRWNNKPSKKGTGFKQPSAAHKHWHIDVSYLNIKGTFYYLCSVLDGYSRYIVHWEIRESMTEEQVELILQKAHEKFEDARPRVISDNGPQFISKDFKTFIRVMGFSHVRTSPFYPQSNGKKERFFGTLKRDCIRVKTPLSLAEARRVVGLFVKEYNEERLHSALGYITPLDKLNGRENEIFEQRKIKLQKARELRAQEWRKQA